MNDAGVAVEQSHGATADHQVQLPAMDNTKFEVIAITGSCAIARLIYAVFMVKGQLLVVPRSWSLVCYMKQAAFLFMSKCANKGIAYMHSTTVTPEQCANLTMRHLLTSVQLDLAS